MKKTLLIADDDLSVRKALGKVLKDAGYDVMEASNGAQTVEQFTTGQVDLLLLDIGLPIRNGWEIFESIISQAPAFPIIVIAGKENQVDTALAAGVGALMEKPLDVAQLLKPSRNCWLNPQRSDDTASPAAIRKFVSFLLLRHPSGKSCTDSWRPVFPAVPGPAQAMA